MLSGVTRNRALEIIEMYFHPNSWHEHVTLTYCFREAKSERMGPSPIVKCEVSTVEMLQNTKTDPVSAGLKSFVGVARSGEKVTK
jgi:hypothetical protein